MCFDTTASNTDRRSWACGVIEIRLGKSLLHLECRHHVYEMWHETCSNTALVHNRGLTLAYSAFLWFLATIEASFREQMMIQSALKSIYETCPFEVRCYFFRNASSAVQSADARWLPWTVRIDGILFGVIGYSTTLGTSYDPWSDTQSPVDGQVA